MVGRWPELFYVRLQCLDVHRRRWGCLSRWDRSHRTVHWQCAQFSIGVFHLCRALAPQPYHDGDGVSLGSLQSRNTPDLLVGHDFFSTIHQRQHTLRIKPVYLFRVRISSELDDYRRCVLIIFYCVIGGLWAVVVTDFLQASILMPFCLVLVLTSLARVGGVSGLLHSLPPEMKTLHFSGEFGWVYLISWTIMVSFGYNTSAMAQRYFSVDDERSARKVALLCCVLFFVGAFLWFIPPMAMRVVYPDLRAIWPALANPSEASYAVASLTLLPHGLIGVMLAAMFSATMANLSAQFNLKSAILSKDVYQSLIRKNAGDRELLLVGWINTFLIGGTTTAIAALMAASGKSVFQIMLTFNTLISLAYGPPALLGLVIRRTPSWSGLTSFITGLVLGILGTFVFHWSLIQQVAIIIPSSFAVFLLSGLFDRGDSPGRARLFKNLNAPINVGLELKDSPDFTAQVFRFLSRTIACIGLLSLVLLLTAPRNQHGTIFWFAGLTLGISLALLFVRASGSKTEHSPGEYREGLPLPSRQA